MSALTNGMKFDFVNGTTSKFDFLLGSPITNNGHILHYSTTLEVRDAKGGGNPAAIVARWNFVERFSTPLVLLGRHNEGLMITLQDNMAGIDELEIMAFGHKRFDNSAHNSY